MSKYSELKIYFRKKGLRDTITRIKSRYFSINEFVLLRNDQRDRDSICQLIPNVEYRLGTIDELRLYRDKYPDLPREFYIDQTHGGKEFYLGFYNGELAQICWVFRKGEYSRFFSLCDESSCELNYIFTLPMFRGNKLHSKFMNYICNELKKQKIEKVVMGVAVNNVNMINGMKDTGFSEFKKVKSYYSLLKKTSI